MTPPPSTTQYAEEIVKIGTHRIDRSTYYDTTHLQKSNDTNATLPRM